MQVLMMLPEVYFLQLSSLLYFLSVWGIGVVFFFAVKRKHSMQELNVFRLYFAVELLFVPAIIEFSILRQKIQVPLLLLSAAIALAVTISIRSYGRFFYRYHASMISHL